MKSSLTQENCRVRACRGSDGPGGDEGLETDDAARSTEDMVDTWRFAGGFTPKL